MKYPAQVVAMAAGAALCACAGLPPVATAPPVSDGYRSTGSASGIRAFVYGKRTVLELPGHPLRLAIQDENGVTVPYEREGRYYRLSRELEHFAVWTSTRVMAFDRIRTRAPAVATGTPVPAGMPGLPVPPEEAPESKLAAVQVSAMPLTPPATGEDGTALLRLAASQLDEVRQAIAAGAGSAAAAKALNDRLDRIEGRLVAAATVMVRVQFDTASTRFAADGELVRALVPAARAAQRINIRGRTDARIAGQNDARIALGRALAARHFLVGQGVDGRRIRVFALPAGRFLAPDTSGAGRALNRRVEIELVDRRHPALALRGRLQPGAAG